MSEKTGKPKVGVWIYHEDKGEPIGFVHSVAENDWREKDRPLPLSTREIVNSAIRYARTMGYAPTGNFSLDMNNEILVRIKLEIAAHHGSYAARVGLAKTLPTIQVTIKQKEMIELVKLLNSIDEKVVSVEERANKACDELEELRGKMKDLGIL